jgi:hypothetical protein
MAITQYENSLKVYNDLNNVVATAWIEGKIEATQNTTHALMARNIPVEVIT